jgi:hypothetical protein
MYVAQRMQGRGSAWAKLQLSKLQVIILRKAYTRQITASA